MLRRAVACTLALAGALLPLGAGADPVRERADAIVARARADMLVDPAKAQVEALTAAGLIDGIADPAVRGTMQATVRWLEGEAAYRLKDFGTAATRLGQALVLVRHYAPGSKLEGDILISSGSTQGETGKVVTALREFQSAYAIFTKVREPRNQAISLVCMASLYSHATDYEAALKYLNSALAAYDGDPGLTIAIQNNRANVLKSLGRYTAAEREFRAALRTARLSGSDSFLVPILRNIARVQLSLKDLPGAQRTIAQIESVSIAQDRYNEQATLVIVAQAAFQGGDTRKAAELLDRSFDGVDTRSTPLIFRDQHEVAYQVYHAMGEDTKAFAHLAALKRLDDQTTQVAISTGAALMAARFDFASQELRIAKLKADDLERGVIAARQQARVQRYIFYGGAGATAVVIAALLAGLIVVRRSRDKVRAANADLALANTALGKALAAKTEFLATTSHEIRTPLNGILGMTQVMLADPTVPDAMRDRLTVVQGAGKTMCALVDDILDVAKMENGKLVLEQAPFDLRATILDATRLWDVQAGAKGIAFTRTLDDCPATVVGDSSRVRQVVFNLLSNALKFTEAGEIAISASQQPDGQVAIAVRDSGIGIPQDKLDAIFESFRQADAGTTRQFGGTGLGLAICRQLARAMGGDVTVRSLVGQGSVFTVTLPLPAVDPVGGEADAQAPAPALLVVERNPISRSLFRTLLASHVERIVFAGGTADALAALAEGPVSRVLIDDATVRADGDAHRALRTIADAAGAGAAITLLWSAADEAEQRALLATGVTRILAKPVSGPSLVATLFRQDNDPLVRRAA